MLPEARFVFRGQFQHFPHSLSLLDDGSVGERFVDGHHVVVVFVFAVCWLTLIAVCFPAFLDGPRFSRKEIRSNLGEGGAFFVLVLFLMNECRLALLFGFAILLFLIGLQAASFYLGLIDRKFGPLLSLAVFLLLERRETGEELLLLRQNCLPRLIFFCKKAVDFKTPLAFLLLFSCLLLSNRVGQLLLLLFLKHLEDIVGAPFDVFASVGFLFLECVYGTVPSVESSTQASNLFLLQL